MGAGIQHAWHGVCGEAARKVCSLGHPVSATPCIMVERPCPVVPTACCFSVQEIS